MFARLSTWLDRTAFPCVKDPEAEAVKVAVLRSVTGMILVWRCSLMMHDSWYYFDSNGDDGRLLHVLAAGAQLALALGLTLGVFPSICAAALLATHPAYSIWTGTYNLAPMLLTPTLGAFAVLETGRLALFGRPRAAPPAIQYRAVYLVLFVAYAGWNFQACLYHIRDAHWIAGKTVSVLFTNSYLSEFYSWFRLWESAAPSSFRLWSIATIILQSVFQLFMLPLMLARWGAMFVNLWGWVFIGGSLANLQISILPIVEVVMWALIFLPASLFHVPGQFPRTSVTLSPLRRGCGATTGVFCGVYGLLLLLFFGNAAAQFALGATLPEWLRNPIFVHAGLVAPNVFNREDLSMGDRWPVFERLDGPKAGLVPFTGWEGERFAYHRSDLLYFGNSLRWRRGMIGVDDLSGWHQPGTTGYELARKIALYDYRRHGNSGLGIYRVTMLRNHSSASRQDGPDIQYQPERVYEFTLQVGQQSP
jgi:hypothetical protein